KSSKMRLAVAVSVAICFGIGVASAQEVTSHLTGSLEGGYWSATRELSDTHNVAVLRLNVRGDSQLASYASLHVEGRIWNQNLFSGAQNTHGELRAAWVEFQPKEWLELKLGNQYMTWGRADGLNPTDLINPKDLTRMVADETEQKF